MSDTLAYFQGPSGPVAVALPLPRAALIDGWAQLRRRMLRDVPPGFTRDEWAYLASFIEPGQLESHFIDNFGLPVEGPVGAPRRLYRPRGPVAVWLPNNVSLLGPLALVLLSLTGQPLRLKLGSSTEDLAGAFLHHAIGLLDEGALKSYLSTQVTAESFGRDDPRGAEMAGSAKVRIVFGADAAAEAIHALPHPADSVGFSFTDRQSEAWLDSASLGDDVLLNLVRVFTIYGQAGCTSPRRVVLVDGTLAEAESLAQRLAEIWPRVVRERVPMHVASDNLKAAQWARALGWTTRMLDTHSAVLACAPAGKPTIAGQMTLMIQPASLDEAFAQLPANIQTVGHALAQSHHPDLLAKLGRSKVMRYVPLAQMHHFSSTWDGQAFWKGCFEEMDCR